MSNQINLCRMQMVLPAEPTKVEKTAARELAEYIAKMSGVQIPTISEANVNGCTGYIFLGATEYAAKLEVSYPDNRFGEGWAIKAADGNLVLTGGKVRGVLYAVYHLLEDVFGVRWWTIWEESVPQMADLLMDGDYANSGVPFMEYRDVFAWPQTPKTQFAPANRLNGWGLPITPEYGGMEYFGQPAHVHTFDRFFPEDGGNAGDVGATWAAALNPEKESYFETHPEWYAMTPRGRRVPKILCFSDEGLQKAILDKLLRSIEFSYAQADAEGKTRPRFFNLSPADMPGECRCPRCDASIRKRGSSGHQVHFVNKIAAEVKKVYPEAVVETIAYANYLEPPKDDTKPSQDVAMRYCNSAMDIFHSIHHPNNKQYLDGLHTWVKLCAKDRMYLWDYGVFYNANGIVPTMYNFKDNFRTFAEAGVNGYFMEIEQCITTDFWDIKVWMATKLAEDPYQDADKLMDTFLEGYYGAAAPYIRQHLDAAHKITEEKVGAHQFSSISIIYAEGFAVEDILFANDCFEKAFAAVGDDETLLRRLRIARMGVDRVLVENYDRYRKEAEEKQLTLTFDPVSVATRICQTLKEQIAFRGEWDPFAAEALKIYEKMLPGYVAPVEEKKELSEEARLSKLHGCRDGWKGNSPVIVDPADLEGKKLYVFTAEIDFAGALKPDGDSELGQSARYDFTEKRKTRVISQEAMMEKNAVADNDPEKCIPVGVYTGTLDSNGNPISAVWGTIRASDIQADGKYHLYKFPDVVAIAKDRGHTFHMFRDWSLLIHSMSWELGFLEGKKVDCYISMKVTGDVTCTDPNNLPCYCVDKVIVADK